MTDRRAHAWGAAIVAAGGLLGTTAALCAGRPGSLWRPLAIGLMAYAASGALVLRWGLEVYGARGALAALALSAFTPALLAALAAPPLIAPAGATTLAGGLAQLAAGYALMRCLLDPTLQWAVLAGLAILAVPIGASLHGSPSAVMAGLGLFSLLLLVCRTITAGRGEARGRVARASAVSIGLAWAVAVLVTLLIAAASQLPSFEEYVDALPRRGAVPLVLAPPSTRPVRPLRVSARRGAASVSPAALVPTVADAPLPPSAGAAALPLAALLLAAARPWRPQRRYTDAGWVAALLCLGGPLWLVWGEPGGVFLTPVAALLAGACWDQSRPAWARRAAALVVGLQVGAAVLLWPRYPGGVRSDAWLPQPGLSTGAPQEPP